MLVYENKSIESLKSFLFVFSFFIRFLSGKIYKKGNHLGSLSPRCSHAGRERERDIEFYTPAF